ncbi:TPA: sugar phosphate isomerase/epimerase [Candidatus Bathyarchaeota archaeon]|nr:sugar phosphate isomerase/epimerase [Candidatus Bathyarchaeota archaeon]
MRLGCSTYSFWHFKGSKGSLIEYMEEVWRMGFDGVEILQEHLESTETNYLSHIKKKAFDLGLDIYCIAIHNNFVLPKREERIKEVQKVSKWLKIAAKLGAKAIRVNSGRWRTIKSFDELMAQKGSEPPIEGYTDEDAFKWVIEALNKLVYDAEEYGVVLALENHWGLTRNADGVLKILKAISSQWVGALMDTGNFIENTYPQLKAIAPYTVMVHAKTYFGGGEWYTIEIDYDRVFEMLKEAMFKGWISLEYEGKENPRTGVQKSVELLKRYLQ